jgi:hypothetical protein
MPSEKRDEHKCHQKCSDDMWCCISWGSRNVLYEVRKEVNWAVVESIHMPRDVVLVEEVGRLYANGNHKWTELSWKLFLWHVMLYWLKKWKSSMQSEKRSEHNCFRNCSYDMWCCIRWGVKMCDPKSEKRWTELCWKVFIWHVMLY